MVKKFEYWRKEYQLRYIYILLKLFIALEAFFPLFVILYNSVLLVMYRLGFLKLAGYEMSKEAHKFPK